MVSYAATASATDWLIHSEWTSNGGRYPIAECSLDWLYQATHFDVSAITSINPDHVFRSINSAL